MPTFTELERFMARREEERREIEERKKEKRKRRFSRTTPDCTRWPEIELKRFKVTNVFVDNMKRLGYEKSDVGNNIVLVRNVPVLEGKAESVIRLKKILGTDKYKITRREVYIEGQKAGREAREITKLPKAQLDDINFGICKEIGGMWKRTNKCCDLTRRL